MAIRKMNVFHVQMNYIYGNLHVKYSKTEMVITLTFPQINMKFVMKIVEHAQIAVMINVSYVKIVFIYKLRTRYV